MSNQNEDMIVLEILEQSQRSKNYAVGVTLAHSSMVKVNLDEWLDFAKHLLIEYKESGKPLDNVLLNRLILCLASELCDFYISHIIEETQEIMYSERI